MNKHGWGLRAELGFLLLFLICLLVSTIGLHELGAFGAKDTSSINIMDHIDGDYNYNALEGKVTQAAKNYYYDRYPEGYTDTVIVSVETLKNYGYLSPVYDSRGKECKGYAKILKTGNCVSYVRCSNYKTIGYSEKNE